MDAKGHYIGSMTELRKFSQLLSSVKSEVGTIFVNVMNVACFTCRHSKVGTPYLTEFVY